MRAVLLIVIVVVLGVIGWKKRDEIPFLRDATRELERQAGKVELPKLHTGNDTPAGPSGGSAPTPGGVRRCVVDGQVLYTNEACPRGSAEQKVKGGTVSVMPAYKAPPPPEQAGSGIPNARELLAPKGGTLKDKAQERAMEGL